MLSLVLSLVLTGNTGYCSGRGLAREVTPEECRESCGASGLDPLRNCCLDCKNVFHLACGGDTAGSTSYREKFNTCIAQAKQAKAQMQERQHQEEQQFQETVHQREMEEARQQRELAERETAERAERDATDKAQADTITDARARLHLDQPGGARYVNSIILCHYRDLLKIAQDELGEERRASRIAGIINKSKLYELQKRIRFAERGIESAKVGLKSQKMTPLSCSTPGFTHVVECFRDEDRDACDEPDWLAFREYVNW